MGQKKKRAHPDVEELLARPWCYYCERDFDDLKILISHQKAKHFKCDRCGRRLNTAGGLSVHMNQVHKEQLMQVENALPNRQGLDVEIFGMEGIPEDIGQAHNQRIIAQFYQAEADRRSTSGNLGGIAAQGGNAKKPKFESPADLKKRLAEHKARKAEQAANGGGSGGNTPMLDGLSNSPMPSPGTFAGSPYVPPQTPYGAGVPANTYSSFSQEPYPSPASTYTQPYSAQPSFSGPSNGGQFTPHFSPPQQFNRQPNLAPGYQGVIPNFQTPHYGSGTPPNSFGGAQGPSHTPPNSLPSRPPSLPYAPGLPQRPSLGPPPGMGNQIPHLGLQGSRVGQDARNGHDQNSAMSSAYLSQPQGFTGGNPTNPVNDTANGGGDDIDKLIRMAEAGIKPPKKDEPSIHSNAADSTAVAAITPNVEGPGPPAQPDKKSKKEKPMRMVYSDNDTSPEEKMAKMARYAFNPSATTEAASMDAKPTALASTALA